jgi:hypothetical protein
MSVNPSCFREISLEFLNSSSEQYIVVAFSFMDKSPTDFVKLNADGSLDHQVAHGSFGELCRCEDDL